MLATIVVHCGGIGQPLGVPGDLSILYPVIEEPPLLEGAVQLRLICDDETAVVKRSVGAPGTVAPAAFTSIATSSQ